jgi:hypothetical protein
MPLTRIILTVFSGHSTRQPNNVIAVGLRAMVFAPHSHSMMINGGSPSKTSRILGIGLTPLPAMIKASHNKPSKTLLFSLFGQFFYLLVNRLCVQL